MVYLVWIIICVYLFFRRDAKTVNIMTTACLSPISKVHVQIRVKLMHMLFSYTPFVFSLHCITCAKG